MLPDTASLGVIVDALDDAMFFGRPIPAHEREEAARWIASRQGLRGAYRGMFAPTQHDFANGIRVFTGERIITHAGTAHVLGEEACRMLTLVAVAEPFV